MPAAPPSWDPRVAKASSNRATTTLPAAPSTTSSSSTLGADPVATSDAPRDASRDA